MRLKLLASLALTSIAFAAATLGTDANRNGLWDDGDRLLKLLPAGEQKTAMAYLKAEQALIIVGGVVLGKTDVSAAEKAAVAKAAQHTVDVESCYPKLHGEAAYQKFRRDVDGPFWNARFDAMAAAEEVMGMVQDKWQPTAGLNCNTYR